MNNEAIEFLELRISEIVEKYNALRNANHELTEELNMLKAERDSFKSGVDSILNKLEGI